MDRRVTEVVIDVLPRGFDSDERRVLIIRPPDERFDVRLSDRLRDVGIDTFGIGSEKRADYILAPAGRNASGGPVPTVIEFALVGVAAAVVAAGGTDTYNALKRFVRSLGAGEPKALTDAEAVVWGYAMIARRYEVDAGELRLLSVALAEPNATVRARGPDGTVYTADIEIIAGLAVLGGSTRELPDPPA